MIKNTLRRRNKRAQGMTEYIIIVGLIAIFVIGAVKAFGGKVNEGFSASTGKVGDVVTSINGTN